MCQRRQTGCRSCLVLKWKLRFWIASYSTLAKFVTCSLLVRPTGTCWSRLTPTVTPGLVPAAATNGVGVRGRGSWWWKSMMERRQFCVRSHHRCQHSLRTRWACCGWCMWPANWSLETCPLNRSLQRLEIWQLGQNNDSRCTPPCSSRRLHVTTRTASIHPSWSVSMRHCPCEGQGRCFRLWKCLLSFARIDIAALEQTVLLAASTLDLEMVRQHDEVGKEKEKSLERLGGEQRCGRGKGAKVDGLKEHPRGWRCDILLRMAWCMRQSRKESLLGDPLAFCQKPLYRLFEVWLCQRGIDLTLRLTKACRRKMVSSALRDRCNKLRHVSKSKHHRCSGISTMQSTSTTPRTRPQVSPPGCTGQPCPLQQHPSGRAVGSRQCVWLWFQGCLIWCWWQTMYLTMVSRLTDFDVGDRQCICLWFQGWLIRCWWQTMCLTAVPMLTDLMLVADNVFERGFNFKCHQPHTFQHV